MKIPIMPEFTHQYVSLSAGTIRAAGHIYIAAEVLYYLGVKYSASSDTGMIPVLLELGTHTYTGDEDGALVCACSDVTEPRGSCGNNIS